MPFETVALAGGAFALGVVTAVATAVVTARLFPKLWRRISFGRSPAATRAAAAAAVPVGASPAPDTPASPDSPPSAPRIQKLEPYDNVEPTDFTKLAIPPSARASLPNLVGEEGEEPGEETPSVSLVSYIDQLEPGGTKAEPLWIASAGRRDVGRRRHSNEDRYVIVNDEAAHRHLFAVVDGIGGRGGGGVASRLTAEILSGRFGSSALGGSTSEKRPSYANALVWAIEHANRVIWEAAQEARELEGMGSTVVAAVYDADSRRVYVAYVGDSRAYRLRRGRYELLTVDHTLAREGPMSNYLRRALGVRDQVKVDVVVGAAEPGDTYLLCTDGLSKMKNDQEIARVLSSTEEPERAADALIHAANTAGGKDNIAVVVFRLSEQKTARMRGAVSRSSPVR